MVISESSSTYPDHFDSRICASFKMMNQNQAIQTRQT